MIPFWREAIREAAECAAEGLEHPPGSRARKAWFEEAQRILELAHDRWRAGA